MKSKRLSNFELMRIVSMFFIVIWHVIMHGKMFTNTSSESIKNILKLIQYIIIIHVNSFVLLSGYFQSNSKFKIGKLLDLVMQVLFYITLILIVGNFIGLPIYCTNFVRLYNYYLSCIDGYWFINYYLIVYIFSDYINKFISSLNYKEYKKFLIIGFVIFSIIPFGCGGKILNNIGYNFYSFIYLYILGAFLRIYPINECKKMKNISNIWYFL
jgi:surface polysaccharide O-acyltransferase-like enzyme